MNISPISPVAAAAPAQPTSPHLLTGDQRALVRAVQAVNAAEMFGQENELAFAFSRNSPKAVIRIVDRNTREVVRQIPEEYVLRMAEELKRG